jgi:endonuclease G
MGIFIAHGLAECEETFLMTNMAPQKPELNREIWADLERKISLEYSKNMDGVWVITGPVFSREPRRLKSGVAIPDYFYKIVIDQVDGTAWRTLSFLMPQSPRSNETPEYYLVSIDRIEYLTGLDFFSEMPDEYEAQVEAWTAKKLW